MLATRAQVRAQLLHIRHTTGQATWSVVAIIRQTRGHVYILREVAAPEVESVHVTVATAGRGHVAVDLLPL